MHEAKTKCGCQTMSPGPEDMQSLLWSRKTAVSDTPSAGGPLLGPEATDNAVIRWSLDAPSRDRGAPGPGHPGDLGVRRATLY